jgi:hypothetical protein
MAVSLNAGTAVGNRILLGGGATNLVANGGPSPAPAPPAAAPPAAPPPPVAPPAAAPPIATAIASPAIGAVATQFQTPQTIFQPPRPILFPPIPVPPLPVPLQQNKTATQLANSAIAQLSAAPPGAVTTALNAIKSKSLDGPGLIPYLERKVRIGEVLNDLAKDWSAATRGDFAGAFSMDANNLNNDVLDSVISIAILNDNEIPSEILGENTPQTTPADLTDNRRIVWQSVPPGTVLNPPYVVLVAVEYQNVATAQDVLNGILNQLGTVSGGFKIPQSVIQKGVS